MKTEFILNWRHWLFGVNWDPDFLAVHFGPCCWIQHRGYLLRAISHLSSEPD